MTSSLDKNQPIYISEAGREELFQKIFEEEKSENLQYIWKDIEGLYDYMFSAENLERYCLGATSRADYAYKKIGKLLRKEYEEWKANKEPKQVFKDINGKELHIGDKVRCHQWNDVSKYVDAIIEKFASTTARVLIKGKTPKYVQYKYIELVTNDSIETLRIKRKDIHYIKSLLDKYDYSDSELLKYINKVLGE